MCVGDLRLEVDAMHVFLDGRQVLLTAQEFDLLLLLAMEAGRPVPLERLAVTLWQDDAPEHRRHLSVLIARLRTKITGSATHRLETLRKRGYGLMPTLSSRIEELRRVQNGRALLPDMQPYAG